MPIKGAYLICSGLAEKMPYRTMVDIDILVKKEDFNRVCDYFAKIPQVTFLKYKWYFEKEFAYSIGTMVCYFEIHWLLNYPARFNLPTENLFNRAKLLRGMRLIPCAEDALIILLCHVLVHIAYEIRATLFEEISLISGQEGFTWDRFWGFAKTTGIVPFFCFILSCYKKEMNDNDINFPKLYIYSFTLATIIGMQRLVRLPMLLRRIIMEFPFVKNPWMLAKHKKIVTKK
jgi:hypothetical protein